MSVSELQFNSSFRLHGILTNLYRKPRGKRSSLDDGKEIAKILPDGEICFAGRKLPFHAPSDERNLEIFSEALNTFIVLISHIRGEFFRFV